MLKIIWKLVDKVEITKIKSTNPINIKNEAISETNLNSRRDGQSNNNNAVSTLRIWWPSESLHKRQVKYICVRALPGLNEITRVDPDFSDDNETGQAWARQSNKGQYVIYFLCQYILFSLKRSDRPNSRTNISLHILFEF